MIITEKPTFFWLVKLLFPTADWETGTIVTFNKKIYCKYYLNPSLIAHENTHIKQQGNHPIIWWFKYAFNPRFRLEQELEAHRNEYRAVTGNRNERSVALDTIAKRLSSSLYKNLLSKQDAIKLISQ